MPFGLVLVTAPTQAEAATLAQSLIEAELAACVSFFSIRSLYTWQGNLEQADEWQLLVKTDLDRFAELEAKVRSLHSYEVPEIIAIPIVAGSQAYLNWIAAQVQGK
jgi:periplasmic divalent cation tolerance protein